MSRGSTVVDLEKKWLIRGEYSDMGVVGWG